MLHKDFFVGYSRMMKDLERFNKIPGYPPHNIVENKDTFTIELAVAGFDKKDIEITLKEKKLTIVGSKDSDASTKYIYKGISSKNFSKSFMLGDYMEIADATVKNGMLLVTVKEVIPEEKKPLKVKIKQLTFKNKTCQALPK